jgi:mRNA-degrading endonuclease RelE of RelBE toxin-antitoxin system
VRTILLATAAERELRRLPPAARPGIRDGLRELAAEAANLDVVALRGRSPWLRLRLGDWRVLYRPVEEDERPEGAAYLVARIVIRRDLERAVRTL